MKALTSAGLLALLLSGCGQTGPLYMPDNEDARERYDPQGTHESDNRDTSPDDARGDSASDAAAMDASMNGDDDAPRASSAPGGDL